MNFRKLLSILGPGLLYAGAAIGVSHLVQSTRAGAYYEFQLVWVLILANILKYPSFQFGPRYASATGNSLIEGYRTIGKWAVNLFALLTIATMFAIQAAVTVVTAGIAAHLFHTRLDIALISAIILGATIVVLVIGRYAVLDKLIKLVIVVLAVTTLISVFSALGKDFVKVPGDIPSFSFSNKLDLIFLIAFVGWMPAPIDVTVWQSLWTVAKRKTLSFKPTLKETLTDFNIGYFGTAALAMAFLSLGALVMFGSGEELSPKGAVFAEQLINLYTSSIGSWAYWVIGIAAFTTMFSTTLTVTDAYPRVLSPLYRHYFSKGSDHHRPEKNLYWIFILLMASGSLVFIAFLTGSMRVMVDLATTISFITAPVLAYLNYRVVIDRHVPEADRPGRWMRIFAWTGIVFLSLFTLFYIAWRIFS